MIKDGTNMNGQKYGSVTVIDFFGIRKGKNWWICKCSCGNRFNKTTGDINKAIKDGIQNCENCRQSILGQKFGKLTVIDKVYENKKRKWKCQCECGNVIITTSGKLSSKHTSSCGCKLYSKKEASKRWKGCGEISGKYFSDLKGGAKRRNLEWSISIEDIWNVFIKQNKKCALSNLPLWFDSKSAASDGCASLDRIDSNKGYILENIQWVHKDVNRMRLNYSIEYFIGLCNKISEHNTCRYHI